MQVSLPPPDGLYSCTVNDFSNSGILLSNRSIRSVVILAPCGKLMLPIPCLKSTLPIAECWLVFHSQEIVPGIKKNEATHRKNVYKIVQELFKIQIKSRL